MLFGLGSKSVFGLDIGSSSVKVVEAKKQRNGAVMTSFSSVPLPEDCVVDGEIVNHAAVVAAIKQAVSEASPRSKFVTTSIAGSSVIIKHIAIPKAAPKDLDDQVYWEAEQYIPFDLSEISLDFEVVSQDMGDGKMDILLVAAKKEFIAKRLAAITESGLQTEILDVDSIALANVFWANYSLPEGSAAVLIDVGASLTKINIVTSTTSQLTRDIAIGGKNLTQEIQNKMGISFQEAEDLKVEACTSQQIPEEMAPLMQSMAESMSLEIRRSLDFYSAASNAAHISNVYLCGGSSRIPGLANILQEMVGLPIEFLNPFAKVNFDDDFNEEFVAAIGPTAAVPLGLALRSLGG